MSRPCPPRLLRAALAPLTAAALAALAPLTAGATGLATGWDEAVQGDFSNNRLAPTAVTLAAGSNLILGTTGRAVAGGPVDWDYFTVTIPAGSTLDSLTVLEGTVPIGEVGFIALVAGAVFTVPPDTQSAEGLLGWFTYSEGSVGQDILPQMAFPNFGSTGFDVPLQAGTYSFWVQETGVGSAPYRFAFEVSAIPEPATALSLLAGLGLLGAVHRRRRAQKV
jgi:hypothetical protein